MSASDSKLTEAERKSRALDQEMIDAPGPVTRAGATVAVSVAGNYQVGHAGQVYGPGETVEVPAGLAQRWLRAGLVTTS